MVTAISIFLVALATIGNSILILYVSKKKDDNVRFITENPLGKNDSYKLRNQINKLESTLTDVQPLIDNYKKQRKQSHWKQYNDWKRMYASKHGRCSQCHGEDIEIDTDYKHKADEYELWYGREIVDYPETARCKCNTCGEVIATWEFKEDE